MCLPPLGEVPYVLAMNTVTRFGISKIKLRKGSQGVGSGEDITQLGRHYALAIEDTESSATRA